MFYHFLNNFYFIIFLQSTSPLSSILQVSIPPLALLGSISTALLKTPRWETSTGILMKVWVKGSSIEAEYCSHWLWRFIPPLQLWRRRVKPLQMWKAKWAGLLLNARVEGPRRRRQTKKVVSKYVWIIMCGEAVLKEIYLVAIYNVKCYHILCVFGVMHSYTHKHVSKIF